MKESDMALETLKGVEEIGGFKVIDLNEARELPDFKTPEGMFDWNKYDEVRKQYPIGITHSENMISFRIQNGPIKEVGQNGCQLDTLIHTARIMLQNMNEKFPCRQNELAIEGLNDALGWLEERKWDREKRGVEGTSQA
jgi:hypothetical protein